MNIYDFQNTSSNDASEPIPQEREALAQEERIERFLCGEMDDEEEASLMEELSANDTLRQQAMAQARLIKGMSQTDQELTDALRHAQREHIDLLLKGKRKKRNKHLWMIAAAASIIFVAFVGWKAYDYHHINTLTREYAAEITLPSVTRGDKDNKTFAELEQLVSLAQEKHDPKAILQLDSIWQLSKAGTYNDYTNHAPYIGWQLAIAHLMKHDKTTAQKVLQEMMETYPDDTAIGQLVRKLTNDL